MGPCPWLGWRWDGQRFVPCNCTTCQEDGAL